MKLPTLSDLIVVGSLLCIAALIWVLDPNVRKTSPYKDDILD